MPGVLRVKQRILLGLCGSLILCVCELPNDVLLHYYLRLFLLDTINTQVHEATKHTPYELVFAQPPRSVIIPDPSFHGRIEDDLGDSSEQDPADENVQCLDRGGSDSDSDSKDPDDDFCPATYKNSVSSEEQNNVTVSRRLWSLWMKQLTKVIKRV